MISVYIFISRIVFTYCNSFKADAFGERGISYACYTIAYRHARKAVAPTERIIADACYTVSDSYAS